LKGIFTRQGTGKMARKGGSDRWRTTREAKTRSKGEKLEGGRGEHDGGGRWGEEVPDLD